MKVHESPDFEKFRLVERLYASALKRDVTAEQLENQIGILYGTRIVKDLEMGQFIALRKALVALPLSPWMIAKIKANETPPTRRKRRK